MKNIKEFFILLMVSVIFFN